MEKSGKKSRKTYAKMIRVITNGKGWDWCGNLGLSLMFCYLYKDNMFIDSVTES